MLEMPVFKLPRWLIITLSIIIPGAGYVLTGRPYRALIFLFFMGFFGFITFQITGENISPIGRFSGGFAVWALSVMEMMGKGRRASFWSGGR